MKLGQHTDLGDSGEENSSCTEGEPHYQSSEQDQIGKFPRSCNGTRGEIESLEKEGPGCTTRASKIIPLLHTTLCPCPELT